MYKFSLFNGVIVEMKKNRLTSFGNLIIFNLIMNKFNFYSSTDYYVETSS